MADLVWARFGDVPNYVEPFFGSGAVLLGRPHAPRIETVNDIDALLANFWRALQAVPDEVAEWADWPVNEADQHARHLWLVGRKAEMAAQIQGDPEYYDAQVAGWWVWGLSVWIGGGWCAGDGPWGQDEHGELVHLGGAGQGVQRKRVHLGRGQGVQRRRVHLGDAGQGVHRKLVHLGAGRGVQRKLVHLGNAGQGLQHYMRALAARLRHVRVCCGDWSRVCGPSPTVKQGLTGMFLDPPYSAEAERDMAIYAHDSADVAHEVREWAIAHGDDPDLRIALCGYEGEHEMPASWEMVRWKAQGGYSSQGNARGRDNATRERIWFSPHCLTPRTLLTIMDEPA